MSRRGTGSKPIPIDNHMCLSTILCAWLSLSAIVPFPFPVGVRLPNAAVCPPVQSLPGVRKAQSWRHKSSIVSYPCQALSLLIITLYTVTGGEKGVKLFSRKTPSVICKTEHHKEKTG